MTKIGDLVTEFLLGFVTARASFLRVYRVLPSFFLTRRAVGRGGADAGRRQSDAAGRRRRQRRGAVSEPGIPRAPRQVISSGEI